jgi:hypothetical protein
MTPKQRRGWLAASAIGFLGALAGAFLAVYALVIGVGLFDRPTLGASAVALIVVTYGSLGTAVWFNPRLRAQLAARWSSRLFMLAILIAGRRREYLEADWTAVLAGAPDEGITLTRRDRLRYSAGFFIAALRMRLRDVVAPAWAPVDWLLASESRTRSMTTLTVGAQVIYIHKHDGLYKLLTEGWGWCAGCAVALHLFFRWLRKVRGIELARAGEDTGGE